MHRAFQRSGSVTMNESTQKSIKVGAKQKRKTKTIKRREKNGKWILCRHQNRRVLAVVAIASSYVEVIACGSGCVCVCLCLHVPIRELVTSESELQLRQARMSAASAKIIWSSGPATEAAEKSDEGLTKTAPTSRKYFEMIFMLCQWNTIKIHIHRKRDRHSGVYFGYNVPCDGGATCTRRGRAAAARRQKLESVRLPIAEREKRRIPRFGESCEANENCRPRSMAKNSQSRMCVERIISAFFSGCIA